MTDIENTIERKINECIDTANPIMIYKDSNKCVLYIPKFAIQHLINKINRLNLTEFKNETLKYRGINVLCGYELAIVLAHEDSPFHPDLINKIELS
ncbi:MAG: hypothetical protein V4538_15660 [Bacteroidota bacterium]